jgi:hypothetical protein
MAKYKFRVLSGVHALVVPTETEKVKLPSGKEGVKVLNEETVVFRRGDVIETDVDLSAQFDKPGSPPKFERIVPGGEYAALGGVGVFDRRPEETMEAFGARMREIAARATQAANVGGDEEAHLSRLSVEEPKRLADEEEVDLKKAKTKEEMVKLLLQAGKQKAAARM